MFQLEPLARQAEVLGQRAGDAVDPAEGLVDRRPDSRLRGVGEHHRAVQVVGVDGVDLLGRRRCINGAERHALKVDHLAQRGAG